MEKSNYTNALLIKPVKRSPSAFSVGVVSQPFFPKAVAHHLLFWSNG
jgi:hypothetical protein